GHRQVDPVDGPDGSDLVPQHDAAGDGEMPDQVGRLEQQVTVLPGDPARFGYRGGLNLVGTTGSLASGSWALGALTSSGTRPADRSAHCRVRWSAVRWHAAACPAVTASRKGGTSVSQRSPPTSPVYRQRGWNGQPEGTLIMLGGVPGIGTSRMVFSWSSRGIEDSSPQ